MEPRSGAALARHRGRGSVAGVGGPGTSAVFDGRVRWLAATCLGFASLGVALAVGHRFEFASSLIAWLVLHVDGPPSAGMDPFVGMTLGILGGSIAGKWLAAWWLVAVPLRRREAWAWSASWAGLMVWWALELSAGVVLGVAEVPLVIGGGVLLLFGGQLLRCRPAPADQATIGPVGGYRSLGWVCIAFAGLGVLVALAPRSFPFAVYNRLLADHFYAGSVPSSAWVWHAYAYGAIGATFAAHFVLLAWCSRHAEGQSRWVLRAVVSSVLVWFVVDSAVCIAYGAWFNVLMINVPTLLFLAPPLLVARVRSAP